MREANGLAWREGVDRLLGAIRDGRVFTFETTLGGETIPALLVEAARAGAEIRMWFVGLASVIPYLTELKAFDNSREADPRSGRTPVPVLVLHTTNQRVIGPRDVRRTPEWAKPLVAAALRARSRSE